MDPRPGGTVIPVAQENPFAMKEATETEMAAVFEKVAAHNAAVVSIEIVVPIGAVKQTSVAILVAKAVAIPIAKTVAITIFIEVCRCAVVEAAWTTIGPHAGRGTARPARRRDVEQTFDLDARVADARGVRVARI